MLKTILSGYSLNRVKDVLDGDNFSIRDIPVFSLSFCFTHRQSL